MTTPDARRLAWEARTSSTLAVLGTAFLIAYSVIVLLPDLDGPWLVAVAVVLVLTWIVFAIDMLARVALSDRGRRARFLLTHPLDVLALFVPLFRALRVASLLQHIPLLRERSGTAVRSSVGLHAAVYAVVFLYVIALTALQVERGAPGASIQSFGDAVWWSLVTITTVGYGDTYPVTVAGRWLAVLLMAGGLVIIGTISAIVVSYITEQIAATRAAADAATSHVDDAAQPSHDAAQPSSSASSAS